MQELNTDPLNGLFRSLTDTRSMMCEMLKKYPHESLLEIPQGFSNNIIWNAAHIISLQQSLTYGLSGNRFTVEPSLVKKYAKGTHPTQDEDSSFVKELVDVTMDSIAKLERDYKEGLFPNYNNYVLSTGTELRSIEDGLIFNAFHEGMHIGYILSIRKQLKLS